jgi:DNA-binding transcriptional LysR family regulator
MESPIYNANSLFQQLDLSALKHFFAVATFGGFSKAARATGASQPALSLGLKKLEKTLGVTLIDRSSRARHFSLTQEGLVLLSFCQRLEGSLESMVGVLGSDSPSRRRLRVGAGLSIGLGPLTHGCVLEARSEKPIELELTTDRTHRLLSDVVAGTLDAAVVPDDVLEAGLKFVKIHEGPLVFVVGSAFKKQFVSKGWTHAAAQVPLVTYPRETPLRSVVDKLCMQNHLHFKTLFAANTMDAIKSMVIQGAGGAFVLKSLIRAELAKGDLVEAKPPFKLPSSGISVATRTGEQGDAISKLIRSWIQI